MYVCMCVCILGRNGGGWRGLHACVALFFSSSSSSFFFWSVILLPAGFGFCVPVCVYGHVFLMKAHAGQINSQKLRGGGSPSL